MQVERFEAAFAVVRLLLAQIYSEKREVKRVKNIFKRVLMLLLALVMVLPFILIAVHFRLYDPGYMDAMPENLRLGIICLVFAVYLFLRKLTFFIFRPGFGMPAYRTADRASYNFFILLTIVLLLSGGLLSFIGLNPHVVTDAMIWISAGIYLLFLVRKTQIFMSAYSIFTAFLYLCALEILPTGIMLVSAMIF